MKIKDVLKTLELFAPLPLQESYDNSGLQIGLTEAETSRVLLCLDVTEEVIEYANNQGCNLIVAHHPLLFRGVKRVGESTLVERCIRLAIKYDIALYAAHTNLDNAEGGVSFQMAQKLGLQNARFLQIDKRMDNRVGGSGVLAELPAPMPAQSFLSLVARTFRTEAFAYAPCVTKENVQRIAVCGGAGEFLLSEAIAQGADVFLTGEMGYHYYHGWEKHLWLLSVGHYESERYVPELMQQIIKQAYPHADTLIYPASTSPIQYYIATNQTK